MEESQVHENSKAIPEVRGMKDIGAEEWERLYKEQKASGKSIEEWCKEKHISQSAYYRSRKKPAEIERAEKDKKPSRTVELVKLVSEQQCQARPMQEEEATASKAQRIRISREDVVIEVTIEMEEEGIKKLLRVIKNAW